MEAVVASETDFWGPEGGRASMDSALGEDFKYFAKEDLKNSGLLPLPEEKTKESRRASIVNLIDFKECDRASDASTTISRAETETGTPRIHGATSTPALEAVRRRTIDAAMKMIVRRDGEALLSACLFAWRDAIVEVRMDNKFERFRQENAKLKQKMKNVVNFLSREGRL
eukprot:gnl/MRDRNA2_/MRDRNA2_136950_c0_seq1.p1 gnl/MRDRNA2_/MRDRNA2_136950_c0~~gnl/MRDRNA2_/MRDRNA2_136950_c0_seq1.p1  ORF type:complete len:190 (-),score=46.45 gnl/MRDRNA2_/MRDRNA2_136950_c0_seq1:33-542(-)